MPYPLALLQARRRLPRQRYQGSSYSIAGLTLDSTGSPLAGCTVKLYLTSSDLEVASTVSDANGNYAFPVSDQRQYYCIAYLAGSPDVAGTTVNTLTGV